MIHACLAVLLGARLSDVFAQQALLLERQSRALRSLADLDAQERARAADAVSHWQVHWKNCLLLTRMVQYSVLIVMCVQTSEFCRSA